MNEDDVRGNAFAVRYFCRVLSGVHIRSDLTRGLGEVVHDYLATSKGTP